MRLLARYVAGCFILGALALVVGSNATAGGEKGKDKKKVELKVKVGDPAPAFKSVDESGKPFSSSDVVGKKIVVLYFYPADFTGGCTAQACGFRDAIEKLSSAGVSVIGVSGDSASTHKMFKSHHKLNFPLLADEKGEVAMLFGVPVGKGGESPTISEKGEKGKAARGVTIQRWTVVIDKAGKVAAIDQVSKAGDDASRIAEMVKKLDTK
jgi:thioredoxin-dependent peroxiredoxin